MQSTHDPRLGAYDVRVNTASVRVISDEMDPQSIRQCQTGESSSRDSTPSKEGMINFFRARKITKQVSVYVMTL